MRHVLNNVGAYLVSLCCIGVAAYLAYLGKDGWGWFLFVGAAAVGAAEIEISK